MISKFRIFSAKLWLELGRRRVIRTSIAYVVVAWVVVEAVSTIFPSLLLPDWTVRLVVVCAILGLPIVIILAWMFDIEVNSETNRSLADVEISSNTVATKSQPELVPPSLSSAIASIAVLPFKSLSVTDDHLFVAGGIATELHSTLAKVHRLRVASRTSSFSLASENLDVKEIAHRLNVHFVISGSVECIDDHMRLFVELDNADEGVQIWSETYDRDLEDIFSIQHEIANAIVSEFGGARLRDEIISAASRPTASLDAWSLVQRARYYTLSFTPSTLADAEPLLHQAIELDESYAAAHAALASVLAEQVLNGLSEDPQSDRQTALESAERASSIAPLDPFVLKMCGAVWAYFGQPDRSIDVLRRAVDIAPFDFGAWGFMGWPLVEKGSERELKELHGIMNRILKAAPMHPGAPYWMYHLSVASTCAGHNELAVDFARQSVGRNPRFPWALMQYANALGIAEDFEGAQEAIERCQQISPGLTTEFYGSMIRGMSSNQKAAELRMAGLQKLKHLN